MFMLLMLIDVHVAGSYQVTAAADEALVKAEAKKKEVESEVMPFYRNSSTV